jgi:DNA replication protein DnaC
MHEKLKTQLAGLRLHGMERVLEAEIERSEREGTSGLELFSRLLAEEAAYQRERSLTYRLRHAQLPWPWTLQSFPFARQPGVNPAQIHTLAGLDFVRRNENLLLVGPTGVGKSGIAIGLLREACLNGHRGCFYNAQVLLDELYTSLADRSTAKLITRLSRMSPLVVDEIGYMTMRTEQANAFFRLMEQRYNRVSTIITTNLEPQSDWYSLFQNKNLVDALLDRLQHHCITIRIDGPSLRTPQSGPEPSAESDLADNKAARKRKSGPHPRTAQ